MGAPPPPASDGLGGLRPGAPSFAPTVRDPGGRGDARGGAASKRTLTSSPFKSKKRLALAPRPTAARRSIGMQAASWRIDRDVRAVLHPVVGGSRSEAPNLPAAAMPPGGDAATTGGGSQHGGHRPPGGYERPLF